MNTPPLLPSPPGSFQFRHQCANLRLWLPGNPSRVQHRHFMRRPANRTTTQTDRMRENPVCDTQIQSATGKPRRRFYSRKPQDGVSHGRFSLSVSVPLRNYLDCAFWAMKVRCARCASQQFLISYDDSAQEVNASLRSHFRHDSWEPALAKPCEHGKLGEKNPPNFLSLHVLADGF